MNAMISAVLSGSHFGPSITDLAEVPAVPNNTGHLFQVVDIARISDVSAFKARMDAAVEYIKTAGVPREFRNCMCPVSWRASLEKSS